MKIIVDFCIIPIGVGLSLSPYIAECQKILKKLGISHQLHAYGTNIEGEWDTVMDAVKRCHVKLHEMGAPRISTTMKIGSRTDKDQNIADKIISVKEKLQQDTPT